MKKYDTLEVLGMIYANNDLVFEAEVRDGNKCKLKWVNGNPKWVDNKLTVIGGFGLSDTTMNYEWNMVLQPMTFLEAIKYKGKLIIEHPILFTMGGECNCEEDAIQSYVYKIVNKEYLPIHSLLNGLAWYCSARDWEDIVENAKFYTEN